MDSSDSRIRITNDEIDGFRITIAARRNWSMIAFLGIWLCGWAVGELMALCWIVFGIVAVPVLLIAWACGLITIPVQRLMSEFGWSGVGLGVGSALFILVWFPFWTV